MQVLTYGGVDGPAVENRIPEGPGLVFSRSDPMSEAVQQLILIRRQEFFETFLPQIAI